MGESREAFMKNDNFRSEHTGPPPEYKLPKSYSGQTDTDTSQHIIRTCLHQTPTRKPTRKPNRKLHGHPKYAKRGRSGIYNQKTKDNIGNLKYKEATKGKELENYNE